MNPALRQFRLIIGNDLRLGLRELVSEKWRSGFTLVIVMILLCFLHIASIGFFADPANLPKPAVQSAAWALVGSMMIMASLHHSLRATTRAADLDLLLSSPVSRNAILIARVAGASAAALMATAFLALPILNGSLIVLGNAFAWGYFVWLLLALTVAGITSGVTSLTVQLTGSTRLLVRTQLVASVMLVLAGLAFQSRTLLPAGLTSAFSDLMRKGVEIPGLRLPALASQGHTGALVALGAFALTGTMFATLRLSRSLDSGLRESIEVSVRQSSARPFAFVTGTALAAIRKDLRLIMRDVLLLSRVLPLALFALPGFFLAGQALQVKAVVSLTAYTAFAVVVMSTQLGKLCAQQEECWDLIAQSPTSPLIQQWMKVAACLAAPVTIGVVPSLAVMVIGHPGLALVSIGTALVCGIGATWVEVSDVRPTRRAGIMTQNRNSDAATPGRLMAAFAFVLMGPLGVGLIGHGVVTMGIGLLTACLLCVVLTCALIRPRTSES